ncbi:hypothetical protein D6858_09340 [Tsuneonella suprasediminis]|uniref:Uncharacterized protein n=1 Tax=Tsuneonella suprasediminis TaxID=2306996 RepID=A0A419R2B6_9SPHN|nr:hypothetical protein [Tsuneonella suprasediminis]RJX68110.1 hypothetical protein D6858_09340 [Tsuneonella suprasediminis]
MKTIALIAPFASLALLAACSQSDQSATSGEGGDAAASSAPDAAAREALPTASEAASPSPPPSATATPLPANTLRLEGLGDLTIGKPVPKGSDFAMRGAQASDTCLIYTSPEYPDAYAIVEDGQVRRITVARGSKVKLVEGIGPGDSEARVLRDFPSFRTSAHEYVEAPAKYLTQPGNDPRMRFEIGADRKVDAIHVGLMPQLTYSEGCA